MNGFGENVQKPITFGTPLNPLIKIFFSKFRLCHLFTLLTLLTSCKVSEKINELFLRYLKTDRLKDGQGLWTPSGKPEVQNG